MQDSRRQPAVAKEPGFECLRFDDACDTITLLLATVMLGLAALLASSIPVGRAAGVEPMVGIPEEVIRDGQKRLVRHRSFRSTDGLV